MNQISNETRFQVQENKPSSKSAAGSDPSIIQQLLSQVVLSSLSVRRIVQAEAETGNRSRSLVRGVAFGCETFQLRRHGMDIDTERLNNIVARLSLARFVSNRTDRVAD